MQSHLVAQNLDNAKRTEKTCKEYNKIKVEYNNLNNEIHNILLKSKSLKVSDSLKRDEINEIYEFTHQFDGSSGIMALTFRENVKNYVQFVKNNLATENYLESRIITRIVKGMIGDAKLKYSQRQGDRFNSLNEFYKWFDKQFQLYNLRSQLFTQLKHWQIDPNTPILNIVEEYKRSLNLFNLTETITPKSILDLTQLSLPESINAIVKGLENVHPRIYQFIDFRFRLHLNMPNSFSILADWINDACIYIQTADINSNKKSNDSIEMNMLNTMSTNDYTNDHYTQSINQNSHPYNGYNNNDNGTYVNNDIQNHDGEYYVKSTNHENFGQYDNVNDHGYYQTNENNDQHQSYNYQGNDYTREYSEEYYNNDDNPDYHNEYDNNQQIQNDNENSEQYQSYSTQGNNYNHENSGENYDNDFNQQHHNNYNIDQGYQYGDEYTEQSQEQGNDDYHDQFTCNNQMWDSSHDYNTRENDNYDHDSYHNNRFERNRKLNKRSKPIPRYKHFECYECGKWGHASVDCYWIHEQFPQLVFDYNNMRKFHNIDSNNNTKTRTHTPNTDKHNNSDDTNNNNDNVDNNCNS